MMFWLLPILVFGPGTLAAVALVVHLVRDRARDRRRAERLDQIARQVHAERVVLGAPNVVSIWQAPSTRRNAR